MGCVIVEHEMHVAWLEHCTINAAQKSQKLPGSVARQAFAYGHARLDIECCEQRGRAMALVIVRHRGRATLLEWQSWLGPVKRLNLRIFFNAQHDCPLRRVKVKPDNISDLLLGHRVVGNLEPACHVRLQPCFSPNTPHTRRRNAHRLGHGRAAPMGGIRRRLLHRLCNDFKARFPWQRRDRRGAGLVAPAPGHAFVQVSVAKVLAI